MTNDCHWSFNSGDSSPCAPRLQYRLPFVPLPWIAILRDPTGLEMMSMQAYDVFMLTVLGAAIAWGAWKGLAWQIASIVSIGLSYFVAVNFRGPVSQLFHYDPPEWNNFLAMLVLYLGTSLVIWVAFNLIRDFLEKVQL